MHSLFPVKTLTVAAGSMIEFGVSSMTGADESIATTGVSQIILASVSDESVGAETRHTVQRKLPDLPLGTRSSVHVARARRCRTQRLHR